MQDFTRRSIPAVPRWTLLIGPGLVWMALAQGSGELIWWPWVVAKYGLGFLFLLLPACLLQLPVTVEIGRYTVLTGEGVFRGFFRLHKGFGALLWLLFGISFMWFGAFAAAGGTALAELTGFPAGWDARSRSLLWGQGTIVLFTAAILVSRVVYALVEWVMKIVAVVSLLGMAFACAHPSVWTLAGEFFAGLFRPDMAALARWEPEDATRLLTAITFAGLGGFWTLFYSYWIKEKGFGMAAHGQRLAGLRGGGGEFHPAEASLPADEPEAPARLRGWMRWLTLESLIGIAGNLVTTLMTCLLAYALLRPEGLLPDGYEIAVVQSRFFELTWGELGKLVFLFVAGAFLADTWLATVDAVARIHLDAATSLWPRLAERDLRPAYYGLVLGLAALTSVTMFLDTPGALMQLSAVLGFLGTVIYSAALLILNHGVLRRQLPEALRPSRKAAAALGAVTLIYGALAALYLRELLSAA